MTMNYKVLGSLNPSSRSFDKSKKIRLFGIRDRLFYLLDGKEQTLLSHTDIDKIYVIQDQKKKELKVDAFLNQYKSIL